MLRNGLRSNLHQLKYKKMDLTVQTPVDVLEIKEALLKRFPDYKVKQAFLNKKALNVIHESTMVVILPKGDKLKVMSNLNIMHSWYIIVFAILLFFTFVGGFLFYGFLWYTKKEERAIVEEQVTNFLKEHYA